MAPIVYWLIDAVFIGSIFDDPLHHQYPRFYHPKTIKIDRTIMLIFIYWSGAYNKMITIFSSILRQEQMCGNNNYKAWKIFCELNVCFFYSVYSIKYCYCKIDKINSVINFDIGINIISLNDKKNKDILANWSTRRYTL